jgi:two-component system, chemotaxis family, response regulator Rcp1
MPGYRETKICTPNDAENAPAPQNRNTSMHKILLAEDNPGDIYLIREALQEHGVDCAMRVVSDGKEVLSIIDDQDSPSGGEDYGLVILDLNLPRHDGIEILERIRESGWMAHIPVVVLTSSDSPRDRLVATHLGARCYLRKPSNLDEFLALGAVFKDMLETVRAKGASHED